MARIRAPADLPDLVKAAFAKASSQGDVNYYQTQVTTLIANNIPFQLRYSPALANKPKGPARDPSQSSRPFDPFENPPVALRISDIGPSHFLVLNKFAVVPEHFIIATRDFKHQTHVLEQSDLEATMACIEAYEGSEGDDDQEGLFAFFNCGEHSGASQPHRHIQLLPVSCMRNGLDETRAWDVLANRLDVHKTPFAVFSEGIRLGISGTELHQTYLRLYQRACRAMARYTGSGQQQEEGVISTEGEALMSYNMAMAKNMLVLAPRLAEGGEIRDSEGRVVGSLGLNGTVLAGTALVKSQVEWDAMNENPGQLLAILGKIGLPAHLAEGNSIRL